MEANNATTQTHPPADSATPRDDPRWELARTIDAGAIPGKDIAYDQSALRYPDLFHDVGFLDRESVSAYSRVSSDFIQPATSFTVKDARKCSSRPTQKWRRLKAHHHETNYDYTETNRSAVIARWRENITQCETVLQLLEAPLHLERAAISIVLRNDIRSFNAHYNGIIGASLAAAVVCLAKSSTEFVDSAWFNRLEEVVDQMGASFEAERLVEFAFRKWGDEADE